MIKKICFYIFLFFCLVLNIMADINIKNYISVLEKCFKETITLEPKTYILICSIIALISILIVIDILLVLKKKKDKNKGINFKIEDGTHGTATWMNEKEMMEVLSLEKSGIILGKHEGKFVKLPFDSYFNKNICVFGSSRKYENNRIFTNKLA